MAAFASLIEAPFNYRDRDGTVTGCDVERARTVLDMIDVRGVELVEAEFAQLLPGLGDGRWRMTTGLFATEERRRFAAFSRPIWAFPNGLLVAKGNFLALSGYQAVRQAGDCMLAVLRDQLQHRSAVQFGEPTERLLTFETYGEAARAVSEGRAAAYASVARAHSGFLEQRNDHSLEVVTVRADETEPAGGCFGFGKPDITFATIIDEALTAYLGSSEHRL